MHTGLFEHHQPIYAELGIATFPVHPDKTPAVRGYLRVGPKTSAKLVESFGDASALGLACRSNRITVLDVDTTDERVLEDGLNHFGPTPFVVRTGSGHFHVWYRHNGERRLIRPMPGIPIDILGDGYVVAPPSQTNAGTYRIVQGRPDDLATLPRMLHRPKGGAVEIDTLPLAGMREGDGRNNALFKQALQFARSATSKEALLAIAMDANRQFAEPLAGREVHHIVGSVWAYKEQGRLMIGGDEATAVICNSEMVHLRDQPLALALLVQLRLAHSWRNGGEFALSIATADTLGVSPKTFRAARDVLVARFFIAITHPGGRGKNDPPRARLL